MSKPERLGGCIEVGAIDKKRDFVGRGDIKVSRLVVVGKAFFWRGGSGPRISTKDTAIRRVSSGQTPPQINKER